MVGRRGTTTSSPTDSAVTHIVNSAGTYVRYYGYDAWGNTGIGSGTIHSNIRYANGYADDIASGQVISELRPNYNAAQSIKFSNEINRTVPANLDVHVVLDNLPTHETPPFTCGCCATSDSRSTSRRPTGHG